jgi:hypothetical protein
LGKDRREGSTTARGKETNRKRNKIDKRRNCVGGKEMKKGRKGRER